MISRRIERGWSSGLNVDFQARLLPRLFLLLLSLFFSASLLAQADDAPVADTQADYSLGAGDVIIITVHNHEDLSGTFKLDGTGAISMSLIGTVQAAGLTGPELAAHLVSRFKPDYLVNPRISVSVQNYRPYYIIGEVNSTGAFNYVDGMSYLTAIAIAGGYSYRAKKGKVFVIRGNNQDREEIEMDVDEKVQPGDIIRVAERMF